MPAAQIAASAPTTSIFLAPPVMIVFVASLIACVPAAHAVTDERFGPFKPYSIDTIPPSILISAEGIKNGEILRGPALFTITEFFSITIKPPIPEAELTPNVSSASNASNLASFIASLAAARPN